ncbi:hypothetical protein [Paenirhodobacter populi]|uniref:hypothetical protein n=1 Tax=Paenirhodobacter populi TaxID=2306993 RepID=UPI003743C61F
MAAVSLQFDAMMEMGVGAKTGADYGEKGDERLASATATALGTGRPVTAVSSCAFHACARTAPLLLEPRRSAGKALTAVIQEAYVRKVRHSSWVNRLQMSPGA